MTQEFAGKTLFLLFELLSGKSGLWVCGPGPGKPQIFSSLSDVILFLFWCLNAFDVVLKPGPKIPNQVSRPQDKNERANADANE
jgi:hypothetical protein